jgi:hypothetical protein
MEAQCIDDDSDLMVKLHVSNGSFKLQAFKLFQNTSTLQTFLITLNPRPNLFPTLPTPIILNNQNVHIDKIPPFPFNLDRVVELLLTLFQMCFECNQLVDFMAQQFFEKHHHQHHMRIFAYLMDLFEGSHQQQVSG